jgi:hypothetical protein
LSEVTQRRYTHFSFFLYCFIYPLTLKDPKGTTSPAPNDPKKKQKKKERKKELRGKKEDSRLQSA